MARRAPRSQRPTSPKRSASRPESSAGTASGLTSPREPLPTAPGAFRHKERTMPGFVAERAIGGGGIYWGAVSFAGGLTGGASPQQAFCNPPCSDIPGALQRCCVGFVGTELHCWTQTALPCSPCGQLRGCARQRCECLVAGGNFMPLPLRFGVCGICLSPGRLPGFALG